MRWLDGLTDLMDMTLSKLRVIAKDREAWCATVHGGRRIGHGRVTEHRQQVKSRASGVETGLQPHSAGSHLFQVAPPTQTPEFTLVLKLISFKEKTGLIQETSLSTLHTWNSCSPPANEPSFLRKCLCACHLCRQRISLAARPPGSVSAFCTRVSSLQSSCPSPGLIHQLPLFLGNSATADSSGTPVPGPGLRRGPSLTHTTPSGPQAVVPHGVEALTHTTPSGPQAVVPHGEEDLTHMTPSGPRLWSLTGKQLSPTQHPLAPGCVPHGEEAARLLG